MFFDERFTSVEAEQHLLGADMTREKRKARLDKIAAQILLAAYLESHADNTDSPAHRRTEYEFPVSSAILPFVNFALGVRRSSSRKGAKE